MLQRFWAFVVCFPIVFGLAFAQGQSAPAPQDKTGSAAVSQLPPDAPVITIEGLCAQDLVTGAGVHFPQAAEQSAGEAAAGSPAAKAQEKASCKTVVTRAQMDKLVYAMDPRGPVTFKMRFLKQYPEMLIFAETAREHGEEKQPDFQERLRFNYIEGLGKTQLGQLRQESQNVSDAEAEKYYNEHPERYVELALLKISIPKDKVHAAAAASKTSPKSDPEADEKEMEQVAQNIRKQAVAGGNFNRLQEKAYGLSGRNKEDAPDTDVGDKWTIDILPKEFAKAIFDLKPGEVSPVIDTKSVYLIYKLVSRHTIPLKEARPKTMQLLYNDAYQKIRDSVNVTVNEEYLEAPAGAEPPQKEPPSGNAGP